MNLKLIVISSTRYYRSNLISQFAVSMSNGAAHQPAALGSIGLYGFARESEIVPETLTAPYV